MPNPLMKAGPVNQSEKGMTMHDNSLPDPINPIPYVEAGKNNAYRGIEDHGVDSAGRWIPPQPEYEDDPSQDLGDELFVMPHERPVKVMVHRGYVDWHSRMHPVTGVAKPIVGRRPNRISLTIVNHDPVNDVFIDSDESVTAMFSGKIGPGAAVTFRYTQAAVWAVTSQAATSTTITTYVSVFEEFQSDDSNAEGS